MRLPSTTQLVTGLPLPSLPDLHRSSRTSTTAQFTTLTRARETRRPAGERIVTDWFAALFLSAAYRRAHESLRSVDAVTRRVERTELAGIATSVLCRHAWIDAQLLAALPDVDQVVVLGAGYDTRAYRFARAIGDRPVFEVDLPPISRQKAAIVAAHPERFDRPRVRRVETDFATESLRERLAAAGFEPGAPTFVAWEGVAMYLPPAAVARTLRALARLCGRGSTVALDLWAPARGLGPVAAVRRAAVHSLGLIGEPVRFQADPADAGRLLDGCGLDVARLANATALTAQHATAGRHCDPGLYVLAARVR